MLKTIPEFIQLAATHVRRISAQHAYSEASNNNGLIIDVREPTEFAKGHILNAINIPRGILEMRLIEQIKNPDAPLFLYCATGGRATLAAQSLAILGYNNVTVIVGSFNDIAKQFND